MQKQIDKIIVSQEQAQIYQSQKQLLLQNQLLGNIKYQKKEYTLDDFKIDLVLKMKVQQKKQEQQQKDDSIQLSKLFFNLPTKFKQNYQRVFADIKFKISKQNKQEEPFIELPQVKKEKKKIKLPHNQFQIFELDSLAKLNPQQNIFMLRYNMLMIILQHFCGFKVKSFITEQQQKQNSSKYKFIYFLLSMTDENLIKSADRYRLQKQIDISCLDIALNQPKDYQFRDIWLNQNYIKYIRQIEQRQKYERSYQQKFVSRKKYLNRKLNINNNHSKMQIYHQSDLQKRQCQKYRKYNQELYKLYKYLLNKQMHINQLQQQYLNKLNRKQINKGCIKVFIEKKKKKQLNLQIIKLNQKYGYISYQYKETYVQFLKPSKNQKYFDKLRHFLLYKPYIESPYGEIQLFNKSQRIYLAYKSLKQNCRLSLLSSIQIEYFTINDQFARLGEITFEQKLDCAKMYAGGLNNSTLKDSFPPFFPSSCNNDNIFEYAGQQLTFDIIQKQFMLKFFLALIPLGALGEFIRIMYFQQARYNHYFSLPYLIIIVVSLITLIELWRVQQNNFYSKYKGSLTEQALRPEYKGPYYRDLVTNNLNTFQQKFNFSYRLVKLRHNLIIIAILILQGIFFWQMRISIITVYQHVNIIIIHYDYFSLIHFVFYLIYCLVNYLLTPLMKALINKLVDIQNYATMNLDFQTKREYQTALLVGIEVIPILFLQLIQPFQKTSCYNGECSQEIQIYIYSRFLIIIFELLIPIIKTIHVLCKKNSIFIPQSSQRQKSGYFSSKWRDLLNFIQLQSKKQTVQFQTKLQIYLALFALFSVHFPSCVILIFLLLETQYIFFRIKFFKIGRRPISMKEIYRKNVPLLLKIKHLFLFINIWGIVFTYQLVQYTMQKLLQNLHQHRLKITENSVLIIKLILVLLVFIFVEWFALLLSKIIGSSVYDFLQKRKQKIIKQKVKKQNIIQQIYYKLSPKKPLNTIFRSFPKDLLEQYEYRVNKRYQQRKRIRQINKSSSMKKIDQSVENKGNNTQVLQSNNNLILQKV